MLYYISMKEGMETVEYASLLYDFYGELLSESQSNVMDLYHEDNLTLLEIAEELGTTRQSVHYTLKKAEKALEKYEDKLGLIEKYQSNEARIKRVLKVISDINESGALDAENKKRLAYIEESLERLTE